MSLRSILAGIEPEAIPFPLSRLYSFLTSSRMMQGYYLSVAHQVLEKVATGRILDIGTGPGWLPIMIASENMYLRVTGVDLSPDMVKLAARKAASRGLKNVDFRVANASELPFPDRSFDLAISTLSFHHWKNPEKALDEIYRVLVEGGEAWIYDLPNKINPMAFDDLKRQYGFVAPVFLYLHSFTEPFYDEKELARIAEASRFKKFEIDYKGITYRLRLYK